MGMFDWVELAFEPEISETLWQTKDMDSIMDKYLVDKYGVLWIQTYEPKTTPEEERPFYDEDIEGFENDFESVVGSMSREVTGKERVDLTGEMRLYTDIEGRVEEITATFVGGRLVSLE